MSIHNLFFLLRFIFLEDLIKPNPNFKTQLKYHFLCKVEAFPFDQSVSGPFSCAL